MKIDRLPNFEGLPILVVGDVMLDRYWEGGTARVSPEAPVPVVHVQSMEERPGGAANVAVNLAALGARPTLVGLTGEDEAADALERRVEASGVRCAFQRVPGVPTITKLRVVSRKQQLLRLDFELPFTVDSGKALVARAKGQLHDCALVICSDYAKGALANVGEFIAAARDADRLILVDPKGADFGKYRGATLLTPNLSEFEAVAGKSREETELVQRGQTVIREHDLEALLVTRGEHGMTLLRTAHPETHLPARGREVFDVTGAGDTVIATLGAAIAAGESYVTATALANLAAGCVVGKMGTAIVTPPELRRALMQEAESGTGVVDYEQLMVAVNDARSHGEVIVMTNGCFDIVHAGHVSYLKAARKFGHRLVVAVNDDESVRRIKGTGRPINNLDRRLSVLAELACVDWVVPFSDDTPETVIDAVGPDVLVKGGDCRPQDIVGYETVIRSGGKVRVLPFVEGQSTTEMARRVRVTADEGAVE